MTPPAALRYTPPHVREAPGWGPRPFYELCEGLTVVQALNMEEYLDQLVSRQGPADTALFTRMQSELRKVWPNQYVFRFGEDLDNLIEWLDSEGIERSEERFMPVINFDSDLEGSRVGWDGGFTHFTWKDREYRVVSVFHQVAYAWVGCPDRQAAEELVEAVWRFSRSIQHDVMVFESGYWEEAPRLERSIAQYSWNSVILPQVMRTRIQRTAETFFRSEEVYRQLGIPWKMGYLLVGPPGTGKTLTTKVLARTCGVPFLYVRGLESHQPDAETLRDMMRGARERAPCILCLEDVDSLVTEDLRSVFLNELDGLEEDYRGVLTVATTNHPERLDPALLHRPARFDYRFEFPLPNEEQRKAFVMHWVERLAQLGYVEQPVAAVDEVVRRTQGMSHAYLKRVLIGTAMRMHTLEERGDASFQRLVLEEVADALTDRAIARRMEAATPDSSGARVGFRPE